MKEEQIKSTYLNCLKRAINYSSMESITTLENNDARDLKYNLDRLYGIDIEIWSAGCTKVQYILKSKNEHSSLWGYEMKVSVSYLPTVSGMFYNRKEQYIPVHYEVVEFKRTKENTTMHKHLTVQEVIDLLMKVEDKSKPCCVWINSQDPEPVYTGGSRIPVTYVDDLKNFGVTDICCEYPVIQNGASNNVLQLKESDKSGV